MDMQPNRNMAVENQLQAVQLGASLYDRAQTQKRMMEQFQLQSAEFLIQKQGMELQNKIRENALATTIKEQKAEVDEFDDFSKFIGETGAYLDNPTASAKFPVMPAFKAPRYRLEANKMLDNFEKYSARAELVASKRRAEAKADAMTAAQYNIAAKYGAFKLNTQTGQQDIDYELVNKIASKEREAALAQSTAKTGSLTGNLEISRGKLKALIDNNASDAKIANAKLEYEYEKNLAIQQLKEDEFGLKVKTQEEQSAINQQKADLEGKKFDFSKGIQLERLDLEKIRVGQLGQRVDIYRQKMLQPTKLEDVKLNAVDDRLVKKAADDIAIKQTISDAIGYEIEILDDPSVDEYVKRASAQNILKALNSPEGKDAVGVEEARRLGQFLEFQYNPLRTFETGRSFGTDLPRFTEQITIKKEEIDDRVKQGMNRVNEIYRKYGKPIPAGTSQTPSTGSTNAAAMSPANAPTTSTQSFKTVAEARAAGMKAGQEVIINGKLGKLN